MVVRCDCRWGKAYQILILKCQKCHSDCNKTQVSTSYLGNNSVRRSDGKPPQCGYVLLTKGSKKSVAFCKFFKTSLEKKIKIPPPRRGGCWGKCLRRCWCLEPWPSFAMSEFVPSCSCCSKPPFCPVPACPQGCTCRAAGTIGFKSM